MKKSEYQELADHMANIADRAEKAAAAMTELADELGRLAEKMRPKT